MSIGSLNKNLCAIIGEFLCSAEDLTAAASLSKSWKEAIYTKIFPHFFKLYANNPTLKKYVARVQQLPCDQARLGAIYLKIVQEIKKIAQGPETLRGIANVDGRLVESERYSSLHPDKLAELAFWSMHRQSYSMFDFFERATHGIFEAESFYLSVDTCVLPDQDGDEAAEECRSWLHTHRDLLTNQTQLACSFLAVVPDEIGLFTGLLEINFDNMGLTAIPASIGNLTKLQRLSLRENRLSTLPVTLSNLNELQVLNLAQNPLQTVPRELKTSNIAAIRDNPEICAATATPQEDAAPSFFEKLASFLCACLSYLTQTAAAAINWFVNFFSSDT